MRVLIAGGGVAALEALLALRSLAQERVDLILLSPSDEFAYRPLSVLEPFEVIEAPRFDVRAIATSQSAEFHRASIAEVDNEAGEVATPSGERFEFDVLVVATGAVQEVALERAVTYRGSEDTEALLNLLEDASAGNASRIVFAVPPGLVWPLPLYELALFASTRLAGQGSSASVAIVTPEQEPLGMFGHRASKAVRHLLEQHNIELHLGEHPVARSDGWLKLVPHGELQADHVVALPRLVGPRIAGLPQDEDGFISVDHFGRVAGLNRVYAAGDAANFPIKQGGIAAQQADVVAEHVAARSGAAIEPTPFRPVLRGLLLSANGPRFLRVQLAGGEGDHSDASGAPLWWPASKVATKYLSPFLALRGDLALPPQDGSDELRPGPWIKSA